MAQKAPNFVARSVSNDGIWGIPKLSATAASHGIVNFICNPGTPVWKKGWDILLILDACRVDLMNEVLGEYNFLPDSEKQMSQLYSVASMSGDWLTRTFTEDWEEEVASSAYISGNPFTAQRDLESEPAILEEVWKTEWNQDLNTIPARPITDRAILTWQNEDVERMIVHYMQPHVPFVHSPEMGRYSGPEDIDGEFSYFWEHVGDEYEFEEAWQAYVDNLRYVLDDVELLLKNVDASRVAISSDHGNAIGEWGIYGHPTDVLLPMIRRVPWTVTEATWADDYEPETCFEPEKSAKTDIEDRLKALGYQ